VVRRWQAPYLGQGDLLRKPFFREKSNFLKILLTSVRKPEDLPLHIVDKALIASILKEIRELSID